LRGRTFVVVLVALSSLLTATAVAGGHRVVVGTKGADDLTLGSAGDRVFARGGDDSVDAGGGNDRVRGGGGDDDLRGGDGNDRLRGGQGEDHLDGGEGNDYLSGRGDGGDPDEIVCGGGTDIAVLGRNDVIVEDVPATGDEGAGDDGCEKVRGTGAPRACIASIRECVEGNAIPCVSASKGCEEPVEDPCVATMNRRCDDPATIVPEADPAARAPKRRGPGA